MKKNVEHSTKPKRGRRDEASPAKTSPKTKGRLALSSDSSGKLIRELHHRVDALEDRVKERTRDLVKSNEQLLREMEEREHAEEDLLRNRKMLQSIFDGISEPLVMVDQKMVGTRRGQRHRGGQRHHVHPKFDPG